MVSSFCSGYEFRQIGLSSTSGSALAGLDDYLLPTRGKGVNQCMKLLTKEILEKLPPLYATENEADPMVWVKFFYPSFSWTWYAIEFDGHDRFFGFVDGDEPELGYFSLAELCQTRDRFGCPIERDLYFEPCRLSVLRARLGR